MIIALNSGDYTRSTARLISFIEEIGAKTLTLLDKEGRTVASTDRNSLGENHPQAPYFIDALRSSDTVFKVLENEAGQYRFFYSRRIESQNQLAGVIVVEVDLAKYERAWSGISDAVLVTDSEGKIILSTEPRWRGLSED